MVLPVRLSRSKSKDAELAAQLAVIDLALTNNYHDLDPIQQVAHLVLWYESEVNNGGHLQYFHNRGIEHVEPTIDALDLIGADAQSLLLRKAFSRWSAVDRERPTSLEDYHAMEIEYEFQDLDKAFYDSSPAISDLLIPYCTANELSFIAWLP